MICPFILVTLSAVDDDILLKPYYLRSKWRHIFLWYAIDTRGKLKVLLLLLRSTPHPSVRYQICWKKCWLRWITWGTEDGQISLDSVSVMATGVAAKRGSGCRGEKRTNKSGVCWRLCAVSNSLTNIVSLCRVVFCFQIKITIACCNWV